MSFKQLITLCSLAIFLSLAACAPVETPAPSPTLAPTLTPTPQPTATHTATAVPSPTASATATPEPLPTETPIPDGLINQTLAENGNVILFLPELEILAVGKRDGTVELLNAKTGGVLQSFTAHAGGVQALAFDFEVGLFATGGRDQTIKLWQIYDSYEAPEEVATLDGHTSTVQSIVFLYGGNTLVSASADGTARIWSLATQSTLFTLEAPGSAVWSVAAYGSTIATGHGDNKIRLWDASTGQLLNTLEGHSGPVWSLAFRSGFYHLVSASSDGTIKIWDVYDSPTLRATLQGHSKTVWSLAFSPDGRTLVSGSDDASVRAWSMGDYTLLTSLENEGQPALSVTFHSLPYLMAMEPDAPDTLIFSSLSADGALKTWALDNRPIPTPQPTAAVQATKTPTLAPQPAATASAPIVSLTANNNIGISQITNAYWSNDGTRLIVLTPGTALIYDSQSLQKLFTIPFTGLAYFNLDGTLGIDGEDTRTTWDVNTGAQISSTPLVSLKGIEATFSDKPLAYHVAAQKLTVFVGFSKIGGELPLIQAINRESGQIAYTDSLPDAYQFVDGAPFGSLVGVSSLGDVIDEVSVVDLKSLQRLSQYISVGYGQSAFAFSGDEQFIAVPNSEPDGPSFNPGLVAVENLRNRDVATRYLLGSKADRSTDSFDAIAFSPADQQIGMVLIDQGWIWDFASGQLKYELKGFAGTAVRLSFSPDNRRVFVATSRGLYLWNLP